MRSTKVLLASLSLCLAVGCSKNSAQYSDLGGSNALNHYAQNDSVSTQGIGNEAGYESMQQVRGGDSVSAKNNVFYFAYDDTNLSSRDIRFIQEQAKFLKAHPNAKLFLGGHTDERGSREYNVGLGERRANRVGELLQISGVPKRQLRVVSYGREKPQVYGHDESAWRKNRRVEFIYENLG